MYIFYSKSTKLVDMKSEVPQKKNTKLLDLTIILLSLVNIFVFVWYIPQLDNQIGDYRGNLTAIEKEIAVLDQIKYDYNLEDTKLLIARGNLDLVYTLIDLMDLQEEESYLSEYEQTVAFVDVLALRAIGGRYGFEDSMVSDADDYTQTINQYRWQYEQMWLEEREGYLADIEGLKAEINGVELLKSRLVVGGMLVQVVVSLLTYQKGRSD